MNWSSRRAGDRIAVVRFRVGERVVRLESEAARDRRSRADLEAGDSSFVVGALVDGERAIEKLIRRIDRSARSDRIRRAHWQESSRDIVRDERRQVLVENGQREGHALAGYHSTAKST